MYFYLCNFSNYRTFYFHDNKLISVCWHDILLNAHTYSNYLWYFYGCYRFLVCGNFMLWCLCCDWLDQWLQRVGVSHPYPVVLDFAGSVIQQQLTPKPNRPERYSYCHTGNALTHQVVNLGYQVLESVRKGQRLYRIVQKFPVLHPHVFEIKGKV